MKCKICKSKIVKKGFSDLLNNDEARRFLKLKKKENICMDCKTDLLYNNMLAPWLIWV